MPDIQHEQDISLLVNTFYGKVQDDERLGYIFNDVATGGLGYPSAQDGSVLVESSFSDREV